MRLKLFLVVLTISIGLFSCNKQNTVANGGGNSNPPPPPPNFTPPCNGRPVINARLLPFGTLSQARIGLVSTSIGNKILFAGGMMNGQYSSRVDIYDIPTNTWSIAELSVRDRQGMAVATVGNKVLFAGGGNNDVGYTTSRVDIYNASTNTWSTAELSKGREYLTATTVGNKVYFAGGGTWEPHLIASTVVDIYDNSTNTWSTTSMGQERMEHSATVVGNKIYFAGGTAGYYTSLHYWNTVDIYDVTTNLWSYMFMSDARADMGSVSWGNSIFWAGGFNGVGDLQNVEIRDVGTGTSTSTCIVPRSGFQVVMEDNNFVFFTGTASAAPYNGYFFEVYDIHTGQWTTCRLDRRLNDATIISVNNLLYVAGGREGFGGFYDNVWRLQFF